MKRKKVLALAGAAVIVFLTGFSIFYVNQKEDEVIPDFVLTYAEIRPVIIRQHWAALILPVW